MKNGTMHLAIHGPGSHACCPYKRRLTIAGAGQNFLWDLSDWQYGQWEAQGITLVCALICWVVAPVPTGLAV